MQEDFKKKTAVLQKVHKLPVKTLHSNGQGTAGSVGTAAGGAEKMHLLFREAEHGPPPAHDLAVQACDKIPLRGVNDNLFCGIAGRALGQAVVLFLTTRV